MGVVNCRLRNDFLRGVVENGRRSVYVCVGGGVRWPGRSRVRATVGERKWVRAVVAEQK